MTEQLDVLAFGAHPDDIELMCAGTLIKLGGLGYKTGAISLTAGELGSRGTTEIRQSEHEAASKLMGLAMSKILDLPDGHVQATSENRLKVIRELRAFRPKIVLAPFWETRHPDHGHCSHLLREAAFYSGLKKIITGQSPFRPVRVLYYMENYDFVPSFIVDISDSFDVKMAAIKTYQSQVFSQNALINEPSTYIASAEFMEAIRIRAEFWGQKIGVKYGEPFLVRESLQINDPVAHFSQYALAGLL